MLTRRQFLIGAVLTAVGAVPLGRLLLTASQGGSGLSLPWWRVLGADASLASLATVFSENAFTVTESGVVVETGTRPAFGAYNALWTRDHAYVLWHYPKLFTAAQRRQFVTHRLAKRSTSPADFIADRIDATGTVTYLNPGAGALPFMDGIAMVVLALWADWNLTGDTSTFTAGQSAIDDCLAAIPRSVNGCVYSNPASPSVDYGFTDTVLKTGDCAYGTALQAWAYKMLDEVSGGGSSTAEADTYANLRAHAESGLATLRQSSGWYAGSSGNNAARDDVWCTALAVAEELVTGTDRTDSATTIASAYSGGTITQSGLVRHLPTGQYWAGTSTTADTYQNGGYWLTPLWNCVRAVALVDTTTAHTWAVEAMTEVANEITASGAAYAPYEWRNGATLSTPKGYTSHAAEVHRFA